MKKGDYTNTILSLFIIILINIVGTYYFKRIDLTSEKKYSLAQNTKQLVQNINDIIYFKIYLAGDIPVEYKKLADELKYILNELRAYSKYIEYEFIDPSALENENYKIELQKELFSKGITPIPHRSYDDNKMEETWIFPGITAIYKSKETSSSLIKTAFSNNSNLIIQKSVENLEYLLISLIRQLTTKKEKIGLLSGHGEITNKSIESFKQDVSKHYQYIELEPINGQLNALDDIDCVVINNPIKTFNEKDKFIIDQFVMNGGKIIWLMNGNSANMDSLERQNEIIAMPIENRNLNDLLFKYGVRINNDIVQDLQATPIPIVTHYIEEKPQWSFFSWPFLPILNTNEKHLITKSINPIKSHFPSSIDLINNNIKKTILLKTSLNTKVLSTPALINLSSLKEQPDNESFKSGQKNIAILLEGVFESVFKNRIPTQIENNEIIKFQAYSKDTNKMAVISDGYLIHNQFLKGNPLPVGFDKHTGKQYGNREFILNTIDYLLDNKVFIEIRSKSIQLRLLNKQKVKSEKKYWQFFNIFTPLILTLLTGLILMIRRKKKYNLK